MSEQENVKAALETVASSPKVATIISAITGALGSISILSFTQSFLGLLSIGISCVIGLYVIKINHTKNKIYERMLQDGESFKE